MNVHTSKNLCAMCNPEGPYHDFIIRLYKYWRLELSCNQSYLGRCMVILNRHVEDLMSTTREEREELFEILQETQDALTKAFQPDRFNYAFLGNETQHLHAHVIPRYAHSVKFAKQEFFDPRWGKNYSPSEKFFPQKELRDSIRDTLKNSV